MMMVFLQDSDVDFVDNVVCNLNKSLCSLDMRNLSDDRRQQMRHAHEMVSAYKELLIATRYGLQTGRLTESETAVQDRENILVDAFYFWLQYFSNQHHYNIWC